MEKTQQTTGYWRLPKVLEHIPFSRARWYQGIARGEFPKPVKLGPRASAWRVEDILELIERISNPQAGS